MGGVVGLDYGASARALALYGLWDAEVLEGLRIIEVAYVGWSVKHAEESHSTGSRMRRRSLLEG